MKRRTIRITEYNRERLVVEAFPWGAGLVIVAFAAVALCMGLIALAHQDRTQAWRAGAVVLLSLVLTTFLHKRRFEFDLHEETLHWSHAGLLTRKHGTYAFDEIETVVLQADKQVDADHLIDYLVLILPRNGPPLPITGAYIGPEEAEDLAVLLREALRLDTAHVWTDSAMHLVRLGAEVKAIALLQERGGLSLLEARQRVRRIRQEIEEAATQRTDS